MMGLRINRRRILAVGLTAFLAACQVVPKSAGPATPAPLPSATALPDDEGRHRIALLVPISGANAEVGQSIANATTMALLDTNASNLRITTYDTAVGAGNAAKRAIGEGNRLILGPLLGSNTNAIAKVARPAKVPLISFSNDVTAASRDIFVMGHIPSQSIKRTVAYASSKGRKRFAALLPNGDYGKAAQNALSNAVAANGGALVAIEKYDRGSTSIISAAQKLRNKGGFDTVLIGDGARLSAMAAGQFAKTSTKPQILGTELWSGESAVTGSAAMRGALFSAVSDKRFKQFVSSYKSRFGSQPHRIATLGYDAVLLTLRVAKGWRPGRKFPVSTMLDKGGFLGLDGPFRFGTNGIGERAMEVRSVGKGAVTIVSAAPSSFKD